MYECMLACACVRIRVYACVCGECVWRGVADVFANDTYVCDGGGLPLCLPMSYI